MRCVALLQCTINLTTKYIALKDTNQEVIVPQKLTSVNEKLLSLSNVLEGSTGIKLENRQEMPG